MGTRLHLLLAISAVVALLLVATPPASATTKVDPSPPDPIPGVGNANFRTFCDFSHASYDDPIVHPNQPGAAHLHFFFGNTATNAFSTPASLRSRGSSTCQGTALNRSAYWMPAVFNAARMPVLPDTHDIYYKHLTDQPASEVEPLPAELVMVAGDATGAPEGEYVQIAYWRCTSWPFDAAHPNSDTIPSCANGDGLRMSVIFPSCWDGTNLDAPDHQSHMSYVVYDDQGQASCPDTHSVAVPQLSMHFQWNVRDASSAGWYLSSDRHHGMSMPGGSTLHADWMNGWHLPTQRVWTERCINEERDCANGTLGDGRALDREMRLGSGRIPAAPGASGPHCNGRPATIVGTSGADTITGTAGDDVIVSYGGDDVIDAGAGFDVICSGNGSDTIVAGPGDDEIWSGSGNDTIDGGPGDDFIRGGSGSDEIRGDAGFDTIRGDNDDDSIRGDDDPNVLHGGNGNDTIVGGYWDDAIFGAAGDDDIDGVGNDDRIWGGVGLDSCRSAGGRIRSCE